MKVSNINALIEVTKNCIMTLQFNTEEFTSEFTNYILDAVDYLGDAKMMLVDDNDVLEAMASLLQAKEELVQLKSFAERMAKKYLGENDDDTMHQLVIAQANFLVNSYTKVING